MSDMGKVLQKMRRDAGITQGQLAEKMDRTQSYVSDVERGRCSPSWRYLRDFANILKVNILTLLRQAGLIDPDTVTREQEIAALVEEIPAFAQWFEIAREIARRDPSKLGELVRHAKWLLEQETTEDHSGT